MWPSYCREWVKYWPFIGQPATTVWEGISRSITEERKKKNIYYITGARNKLFQSETKILYLICLQSRFSFLKHPLGLNWLVSLASYWSAIVPSSLHPYCTDTRIRGLNKREFSIFVSLHNCRISWIMNMFMWPWSQLTVVMSCNELHKLSKYTILREVVKEKTFPLNCCWDTWKEIVLVFYNISFLLLLKHFRVE